MRVFQILSTVIFLTGGICAVQEHEGYDYKPPRVPLTIPTTTTTTTTTTSRPTTIRTTTTTKQPRRETTTRAYVYTTPSTRIPPTTTTTTTRSPTTTTTTTRQPRKETPTTTTRRPTTTTTTPPNFYLPPKTYSVPPRPRPTTKEYETEEDILAEFGKPSPTPFKKVEEEHKVGNPYDYKYAVQDEDSKNIHGHESESHDDVVTGEYRTLMADGRTHVVRYTADWKSGYRAKITYEGQIQPYFTAGRKSQNIRVHDSGKLDGAENKRQPKNLQVQQNIIAPGSIDRRLPNFNVEIPDDGIADIKYF